MDYEQYKKVDQSWASLSEALAYFSAEQNAAHTQALKQACENSRAVLFNLAQTVFREGNVDLSRKIMAMVPKINDSLAAILSQKASLDASLRDNSRTNVFGTFLDTMGIGDKVRSFQSEVSVMQGQCNELALLS